MQLQLHLASEYHCRDLNLQKAPQRTLNLTTCGTTRASQTLQPYKPLHKTHETPNPKPIKQNLNPLRSELENDRNDRVLRYALRDRLGDLEARQGLHFEDFRVSALALGQ